MKRTDRPGKPAPTPAAAPRGAKAAPAKAAPAPKKAAPAAKTAAPKKAAAPKPAAAPAKASGLPVRRAIVGLLGGIGSGKSTVSAAVARRVKASVIDADAFAREALDVCARDGRLAEALGAWAVNPDRTPNRKAIAAKAFDVASVLRALERLTHPAVTAKIEDAIEDHRMGKGAPLLLLDVPLLIEVGLDRRCDTLWFVDAPDAVRFARARERLKLTPDDVRKREAAQAPLDRKRARADVVLDNGGTLDALETQVEAALRALGA
ncbi:MAG: dephospho-CoA kinase [Planctomycetota bacterium]